MPVRDGVCSVLLPRGERPNIGHLREGQLSFVADLLPLAVPLVSGRAVRFGLVVAAAPLAVLWAFVTGSTGGNGHDVLGRTPLAMHLFLLELDILKGASELDRGRYAAGRPGAKEPHLSVRLRCPASVFLSLSWQLSWRPQFC